MKQPLRTPSLTRVATALTAVRLGVGAAAVLRPDIVQRSFGIDPDANRGGDYLMRLFGAREFAVAAMALGVHPSVSRPAAYRHAAALDAADALAVLLARRAGKVDRVPFAGLLGGGVTAILVGLGRSRTA